MKTNTFKTETPRYDEAAEAMASKLYALFFLLTVGSFAVGAVFTYLVMR